MTIDSLLPEKSDDVTLPDVIPRRRRFPVGAAVVVIILSLGGAIAFGMLRGAGSSVQIPAEPLASGGTPAPSSHGRGSVLVHVHGAVAREGLYELAAGSRVIDVVMASGGFAENADQAATNLARLVVDGEQLRIPALGEQPPSLPQASTGSSAGGSSATGSGSRVNLNTATETELDTLPRIGPSLAARIVEWREKNGRFTSVDDLSGIDGFGEKTIAQLRDLVTV